MKLSLDLLRPDPANARKISDGALDGLAVSAETFGDLSGITWNEQLGVLVTGHQRMKVLVAAGAKQWVRDGDAAHVVHPKTKERFRIRIVKWDEVTHRMAELTANNQRIQGEYEDEMAAAQLAALEHDDRFLALGLAGLEEDIAAALADVEPTEPAAGLTDPDEVPDPPAVPITKPGDLWILGEHRLLCGDSTKPEDVARLMDGKRALMMATDPPYGVDYTDEIRVGADRAHVRPQREQKWAVSIDNDDKTGENIQPFLEAVFRSAADALEPNAAWYLWHAQMTQGFFAAAAAANLILHRQIIWVKPSLLFGFGDYHWRHELCFYGWVKGNRPPFYGERNQTTIWEFGNETSAGNRVHPTQKPVRIFQIPMHNHTKPGEICYEPFSGSGSQLIAGQTLGRRVFAMEVDPQYCDVAVTRWEAFTGQKATRESC